MSQHCLNRVRMRLVSTAAAVLFVASGPGTAAASGDWTDGAPSDLRSVRALYRDGAGGLGIPMVFLTGAQPEWSIGVVDADHDGRADLAMWCSDTDTMWTLSNDGTGGFHRPRAIPAGLRQRLVAVSDFDDDGLDDHAVIDALVSGARLRFGDDVAGLRAAGTFPPGAVLVTDLDRDARIDLVAIDGASSELLVVLGTDDDGSGIETLVPVGLVPGVMAAGDVDGDGILDLVLGDRNAESVVILAGDLDGGFTLMQERPVGLRPVSLALGDLTGDGMADLVAVDHRADRVVILRGDGTGDFGKPTAVAAASRLGADGGEDSSRSGRRDAPVPADPARAASIAGSDEDEYEGVLSLALSPSTIAGGSGAASTGTVTLNAPAPAGGVVVTLGSSNVELAATVPSITVPAGATQATFTVATNGFYRRWSGLGFSVTISATHAATASATLNLTAQARPAAFNSGVAAGQQTQWAGLMCSNIPPMGFEGGILFECTLPPAIQGQWGSCRFRQECSIGCRREPPGSSVNFNDFCATTGPNPIAIPDNYVVSGDRPQAHLVLEAPAPAGPRHSGFVTAGTANVNAAPFANPEQPVDPFFPFPNLAFETGASIAVFDVGTSYVPSTEFVLVSGEWHPPGGNGNFFIIDEGRSGIGWIVMVPPDPAPAVPIPTLGEFKIVGLNPVTGGQPSLAQFHLSGLPHGAGPTITVTSSHPAIVPPFTVAAPTGGNLLGFDGTIGTAPPAADTDVMLTASDGRYSSSRTLRVLRPPPPPVLAGVSVNPTSVVGGNSATGTVTLSAPQSGPTVVQVSIIDTAPAALPSNDPPCPPSSRCHNVMVPAGATSATFTIQTSPVTFQFNLGISAHLAGSPGRTALLLITTGAPPALRNLAHSPDTVIGGQSATGTVTLTAPALSGGAVIALSDNSTAATVPASVTIPAGQTSADFPITTTAVTNDTTALISATFGGETFNDGLVVLTILRTVELNPSTVVGGNPSIATVILGTPAPAGGAVVTLSSSNTSLVTVPASVTVPGGATSAPFTASTTAVTSFSFSDISASYGGATVSSRLFLSTAANTVTGLAVNPSSVVGPGSVTATVTLGGSVTSCCPVVELTSSDPSLAQVPASLSFSLGQSNDTFTVNVGSVIAPRTVTITASLNGTSRSASLTVNPPTGATLSAVTLSPASVPGGSSATGTVTLNGPAPSGGATVNLSSSRAAAVVPASVTVAAGATSASFNVATTSVTSATTATISATYGGVIGTATLTITPTGTAPPVSLATLSLNPASVAGGNTSTGTVTLSGAAPAGGATVTLSSSHAAATVPSSVTVAAGGTSATFTVSTNAVSSSTTVVISGTLGAARSANLTLTPPPAPPVPSAPNLVSPAHQATVSQPITFDWTNATNATSYLIQIDNSSNFTTPLTLSQTVSVSQATIGGLPAQQLWWRVRGINSAGVAGPFSSSRRFTARAAPAAASLSALSVSPTSVTGGNTAQGTVTLTGAAPAGGAIVTLSSSNTSAATVPATVTVAAGATSAGFTVSTAAVATSTSVTLAAAYDSVTRTAALSVTPPPPPASLSALGVTPTSVTGGNTAQATVTLTGAAPAGGAVVTLSSSNTSAATVPATVTVAAGATSAGFTVSTTPVGASTSVTLTAAYNSVTHTAALTVNLVPTGPLPAPSLVSPSHDARFSPGQSITFDWSDVSGAANYTIQIDDDDEFPAPHIVSQSVTVSQFSSSTLPTRTMWWRVRANDATGNPGSWSSIRRFEVKG